MNPKTVVTSKLELDGERVTVDAADAVELVTGIFTNLGCPPEIAREVARHLTESNLYGVESHGLMRTLQYAGQYESGYMRVAATPHITIGERGATIVDGRNGIGIPAMRMAVEEGCRLAEGQGIAALAIRNVGHTGRLGAFTEAAAYRGYLCIVMGGGGRENWRQVAPYGGRRAVLPTNPYSIGIPGGHRGPVVLDFATSKIAGGWIYAARSAGARLPDNVLLDREGHVTRDPEDYFRGGAIMPAGGAKGYALAVAAELIAEAMLGPTETEGNWLMITLDTTLYRDAATFETVAEEILAELRACPPAPEFDRVQVPGEREREHRDRTADTGISLPEKTWEQIVALSKRLARS